MMVVMNNPSQNQAFEAQLMQELCRFIEANNERQLSLEELAKQAQLAPTYLQKRFKAVIGVTPKEYADHFRMKNFKQALKAENSVTEALYDVGYGSASRLYEKLDKHLGMTPKQYRGKGKGMEISYALEITPLGLVMIGATDRGICFVQFGENEETLLERLQAEYSNATIQQMTDKLSGQFKLWMKALSDYLSGDVKKFDLPLDIQGTAFQMKVWKYLQTIPVGKVYSYTEVAEAIGHPKAVRAVASACGKNNVAIVIPCHRVLRGNGDLAGYRWGLERKRALLNLERSKSDI